MKHESPPIQKAAGHLQRTCQLSAQRWAVLITCLQASLVYRAPECCCPAKALLCLWDCLQGYPEDFSFFFSSEKINMFLCSGSCRALFLTALSQG